MNDAGDGLDLGDATHPGPRAPAASDPSEPYRELIPSDLFRALKEHRLASRFSDDCDFVFATSKGTPMDHRNVAKRGLDKPKERAGIDRSGKPSLSFHDLRHTYASANIAAGVDVVYLSRQLDHAQPSITLISTRTYSRRVRLDSTRDLTIMSRVPRCKRRA